MRQKYDVLIIGAGVVGNAIAREFSRYKLNLGSDVIATKNINGKLWDFVQVTKNIIFQA